ncbi:hypothetical protein HIM_06067 [Hirsutella minnesotensis 3608]|uniref:Heme haloperoxidase family profile domain-containing protein n=1 Tax=Hirsutella minnesotensis 3608 TaxID=1043627 RepID=A0A0F7ZJJ5_9HYPO|nr:hypothetical protein HIM_06067 [Hirsutella minnesotensis 3608]
MKFSKLIAASLLSVVAAQFQPILNLLDKRFLNYVPAGPTDSRSPCPALNALANHGFLPHNGRNVNIADFIVGLFLGLGVSPDASSLIIAFGIISSHNPLSLALDLEDLANHNFVIEHDCSFARQDALVGDNLHFNRTLWKTALDVIGPNSQTTNAFIMGTAKAMRVREQRWMNPKTVWGPRAWLNSFSEVGLVLSAMGSVPGIARTDYVRSFIEEERLPYHLGWRPRPFFVNTATFLGVGALAALGDPDILKTAASIVLGAPEEILETFVPPQLDYLAELENLIFRIGFDNTQMKKTSSMLRTAASKMSIVGTDPSVRYGPQEQFVSKYGLARQDVMIGRAQQALSSAAQQAMASGGAAIASPNEGFLGLGTTIPGGAKAVLDLARTVITQTIPGLRGFLPVNQIAQGALNIFGLGKKNPAPLPPKPTATPTPLPTNYPTSSYPYPQAGWPTNPPNYQQYPYQQPNYQQYPYPQPNYQQYPYPQPSYPQYSSPQANFPQYPYSPANFPQYPQPNFPPYPQPNYQQNPYPQGQF